jgi:hypothetical protein
MGDLTPNHKPIENKDQLKSNGNVLYTIGKIFSKAIIYCPCTFKIDLI